MFYERERISNEIIKTGDSSPKTSGNRTEKTESKNRVKKHFKSTVLKVQML